MIDQRRRTFTGGDAFNLCRVTPLWLAGEVGNGTARPRASLIRAPALDQFGEEGEIVDVRRRPHTDFPAQLAFGQITIGIDIFLRQPCRIIGNHPRAFGEAEPVAVRLTEPRRDRCLKRIGLNTLCQPRILEPPERSGIRCDYHIRRTGSAFGFEGLQQFRGFRFANLDFYSCLILKGGIERLVRIIVPGAVDRDALRLGFRSWRARPIGLRRSTATSGQYTCQEGYQNKIRAHGLLSFFRNSEQT